jgi:hypothetical protein
MQHSSWRFKRDTLTIYRPALTTAIPCVGYGIASVFTPPQNRRKGYAKHMMRLLHWVLAPETALPHSSFPPEWGEPPIRPSLAGDALFSVLYSDVGEDMYRSCGPMPSDIGWSTSSPVSTTVLTAALAEHLSSAALTGPAVDMEWIYEHTAIDIWERDSDAMRADLEAFSNKEENRGRSALCILPSRGTAAFLNRRAAINPFVSQQYTNNPWGVLARNVPGKLAFATWAPDPQNTPLPDPQTLVVTQLRSDAEQLPFILQSIIDVIRGLEIKLQKIEIWDLPKELEALATSLSGITGSRKEHLSSIKVYRGGREWEWLFNEK